MTANEFQKLALSLPEAFEGEHFGHMDFRVGKKIFATIGYPNDEWAMVKLTPHQQAAFVRSEPKVYRPVKGGWGVKGATNVCLKPAEHASVRQALVQAWRNTAPKKLSASFEEL